MNIFQKTAIIAFGLFCLAGAASAQTVSQSRIVDEGGSGEYPVTIVGSDGLIYRCRPDVVVTNGLRVRYCIPRSRFGLAPDAGIGVAAATLLVLVAVAASDGT